jgi:hypothetical protein
MGTDVSEQLITSIFRVENQCSKKPDSSLPPAARWFLVPWSFDSEDGGDTPKPVHILTTWRYLPEVGNIHNYGCENLKSHIFGLFAVFIYFLWCLFISSFDVNSVWRYLVCKALPMFCIFGTTWRIRFLYILSLINECNILIVTWFLTLVHCSPDVYSYFTEVTGVGLPKYRQGNRFLTAGNRCSQTLSKCYQTQRTRYLWV